MRPHVSEEAEANGERLSLWQWLRFGPWLAQVVIIRRCNLSCGYCSEYDKTSEPIPFALLEARLEKLRQLRTWTVCLTGGEPTLQKELPQLAQELLDRGYQVSLETHGQRPLAAIPRGVRKIVDLKTPGSEEPHTDFSAFRDLAPGDEVKVVVCSRDDFQWALRKLDELQVWNKVPVLFSPAYGEVAPQDLAAWVLESGKPARLQLQLHKLIWGERRGV